MRKGQARRTIQVHHIEYDPEKTVKVWRNEHWAITIMQRRKRVSKGFIEAMRFELDRLELNAIDLGETNEKANAR